MKGWILYRILKFSIYFQSLFREILTSQLADDEQLVVISLFEKLMRHFDHVMIVCARKPLIRSDHDVTSSFLSVRDLRLLIKVTALRIRNMSRKRAIAICRE